MPRCEQTGVSASIYQPAGGKTIIHTAADGASIRHRQDDLSGTAAGAEGTVVHGPSPDDVSASLQRRCGGDEAQCVGFRRRAAGMREDTRVASSSAIVECSSWVKARTKEDWEGQLARCCDRYTQQHVASDHPRSADRTRAAATFVCWR